jgi:hypothetical protein
VLQRILAISFCVLTPLLGFAAWQADSEAEALSLRRIADFWEEGEYSFAKREMEEFLIRFPESSFGDPLSAALGDLHLREGQFTEALADYAKIKDPSLLRISFGNRMQCLYSLEWYATLVDACAAELERADLAENEREEATYYLAISLYQQMVNLGAKPDGARALAERAKPYFDILMSRDHHDDIGEAFAHVCSVLKDFPKAASIYLDLAKRRGDAGEMMLFQAALVQAEFDKELAAKTFADIGGEKSREATFNRLVLMFDLMQFVAIVEGSDEWVTKVPDDKRGLTQLYIGKSLLALGRPADAHDVFSKAVELGRTETWISAALSGLIDASFQLGNLDFLTLAIDELAKLPKEEPFVAAELAKGCFSRALLLKRDQKIDAARSELEALISANTNFPQRPQVLFELTHLEFQEKAWARCHARAAQFLAECSSSELASFAWRYLISSRMECVRQNLASEEMLAQDLEALLATQDLFGSEEKADWEFVLAKSEFDRKKYDAASARLQKLVGSSAPFTHRANAHLILALIEKEKGKESDLFVSLMEGALSLGADLMDKSEIHMLLFNAYLNASNLDKAADHLYWSFDHKGAVSLDHLVWLGDFYGRLWEENGDANALAKATFAIEGVLKRDSGPGHVVRLAKLYLAQHRGQDVAYLLKQYPDVAGEEWCFLLAKSHELMGQTVEALQLFDQVTKEPAALRARVGAESALAAARLRLNRSRGTSDEDFVQALNLLKDLVLQRNIANEPVYLEAALDYVEAQAKNDLNKKRQLLEKVKRDFERDDDLLARDYHEARKQKPKVDVVYREYMQFIDAEVLIAQKGAGVDVRVKAKKMLSELDREGVAPTLRTRVQHRLDELGRS